jgi:uncharacterized membrane protein (UPF0127 family)
MAESHDLVVDGRVRAPVEVAPGFRARQRGLLGRDGLTGALWLAPCRQVHTFGMRFAIDVAYVDRRGRVLAVHRMRPGRLARPHLRARAVVEAEAGAFAAWNLAPGSAVRVERARPAVTRRR